MSIAYIRDLEERALRAEADVRRLKAEVERLRGALNEIAISTASNGPWLRRIARAALEAKP
jgi:hypothetical protein